MLNNNLEFENYNGWTNRDTWLVALWLDNDRENYIRTIRFVNGVGRNKKLNDYTDLELWEQLKNNRTFKYGDKINWNRVNITEIREKLTEYIGLDKIEL